MYDCLIIGAGAAGLSCALVLGSAKDKPFAKDKSIGIIAHQRASHLQSALFNNVLGFKPGTKGLDILSGGIRQLQELYPHIDLIYKEKTIGVIKTIDGFEIITNKNHYRSKLVVVAIGYTNMFNIEGLNQYIAQHPRAKKSKDRVWLKNIDHLVDEHLYVAGTLAGWRSQFSIAAGSGSHVATDILTLWNGGEHVKVHDKL